MHIYLCTHRACGRGLARCSGWSSTAPRRFITIDRFITTDRFITVATMFGMVLDGATQVSRD